MGLYSTKHFILFIYLFNVKGIGSGEHGRWGSEIWAAELTARHGFEQPLLTNQGESSSLERGSPWLPGREAAALLTGPPGGKWETHSGNQPCSSASPGKASLTWPWGLGAGRPFCPPSKGQQPEDWNPSQFLSLQPRGGSVSIPTALLVSRGAYEDGACGEAISERT